MRNCTIEGFLVGISIAGSVPGLGHVIEANRLSLNRYIGIDVVGFGSVVCGNIVDNTGGGPGIGQAWGIRALGGVDVIDNVVDGTVDDGVETSFSSTGIWAADFAGQNPDVTSRAVWILGNRVRNLLQKGLSLPTGIAVYGTGIWVRDNLIAQSTLTSGSGVYCVGDAQVRDNVIKNYSTGLDTRCTDNGGNVAY